MLAGEPPYTGPTAQAIVAKRLSDPVPSARRLRETVPPARGRHPPAAAGEVSSGPVRERRGAGRGSRGPSADDRHRSGSGVPTRPPHHPTALPPYRRTALLALVLLFTAAADSSAFATAAARHPVPHSIGTPVAILPFRVTAPGHDLDYLAEGLVDLLAVKLDGSAGIHAVQPRAFSRRWATGPRRAVPPTRRPRPRAGSAPAWSWTGASCARPGESS